VRRLSGTFDDWKKVRLGVLLLFGGVVLLIALLVLFLVFLVLLFLKPERIWGIPVGALLGWPLVSLFAYETLVFASSCLFLFAPVRYNAKRLARVFCGATAIIWLCSILVVIFVGLPLATAVSRAQEIAMQPREPIKTSNIPHISSSVTPLSKEQKAALQNEVENSRQEFEKWKREHEKTMNDLEKLKTRTPPSVGAVAGTISGLIILIVLALAAILQIYLQPFLFSALARNLKADELAEGCLEFMKLSLIAACISAAMGTGIRLLLGRITALSVLLSIVEWILILINLALFFWYFRILYRVHRAIGEHLDQM
jgi:hypothetical protein